MELEHLIYFKKVADLEHMTQAAEELYISQPSLSLAIKRLESELGTPLFERRGRNVKLNSCGQILLKHVTPALESLQKARDEIEEYKRMQNNLLTILSPSLYGHPDLMVRILTKFPELSISYIQEERDAFIRLLLSGKIDFCISTLRSDDSRVVSEFLYKDPLVVIVAVNHPLASRESVQLEELSEQPFAAHNTATATRLDLEENCRAAGFEPRIYYEGKTSRDLLAAAAGGKYLFLQPKRHTLHQTLREDVVAIPISGSKYSSVRYLSYLKGGSERPIANEVMKIIRDYFAEVEGNK